jgi:hypothetical protein
MGAEWCWMVSSSGPVAGEHPEEREEEDGVDQNI